MTLLSSSSMRITSKPLSSPKFSPCVIHLTTLLEDDIQTNQLEPQLHKQKQSTGNLMKRKIRLNSLMTHPLLQFNASLLLLDFRAGEIDVGFSYEVYEFLRSPGGKSQQNFIIGIGRYQRNARSGIDSSASRAHFHHRTLVCRQVMEFFVRALLIWPFRGFVIMFACFIGQKIFFQSKIYCARTFN